MSRLRRFYKTENEILQLLNASDSDDEENVFELDIEDRAFLDDFTDLANGSEIEIEDIPLTENPSTSKSLKTNASMAKCFPKPKDAKELLVKFEWKKTNKNYVPPAYTDPDYIYGQVLNPKVTADEEIPTVLEVFNAVCDFDTLIKHIIHQTKLYCEQKGVIFSIIKEELKAFFGMIIAMTIHRLPEIRLYWSTMEIYSVPFISKVMTRDRFEKILSSLHFVNNAEQPSRDDPSYDRAFKIRPVINHFNSAFGKNLSQSKCQSIDEHMVKFKGRNTMKQYMKDKPLSWGFKLWCRCDAKSGYLYKIDIYTGKKEQREVGIGESVIIDMAAGLENMGIELYFDNFFNSPMLLHKLMTNGIRACGTLRKNRAQMPKFDADKSFDRGDFQSFASKGVSVVKWMDNRAVHMGSNFINPIDIVNVKRRQVGTANKINVTCSKMISQYNAHMGGVDLMDQKKVTIGRRIGLYRFCGDIGRGNFSKVKLAVHQLTRDKVAIKVVDRGGLDTKALRMLSSEIATLECVHHPHILRLFEVVETLGRVYLVTEWIRGGELYNHITQGGPLREIHAAPLYKQLLHAVKHMHTLGFVHRDIKAENVLLLSEDRLKLADFGFSTQLVNGANQKLDTFCGSPPYAAPELFSDDHYIGAPVDVWALGILLYFMVVGNMPFRAPTIPGLKAAILKGDYLLPGQLSLPCIRLIQRTLIHLPVRRPTIEEMLDSQFVTCPKLSAELMQHEINLRSKPIQRSGFWVRSKSRRMRKTYSLRERYMEVTDKPPLNLNTKKNDGSLVDNFLHPIEINRDLQQFSNKESSRTNTPKRYFFCGSLKKKVSPMEAENEMYLSNCTENSSSDNRQWNSEAATACPLFKNYDTETGNFIMHPTNTCDLGQLSPLEVEARKILEELGVTSEMLKAAIQNGPRSEIIGAYRIIVNRLQKQSWLARKHVEIALQEIPKAERKFERSCCIL